MKAQYQMMKYHQGINKPSSLFMMAQGTKMKNVCLPKRHVIGIKNQLKTTNVQKHIGLLPQDLCIIYDLAFEYKMHTNEIITLHIYYSNTSHVQERQEDAIPN